MLADAVYHKFVFKKFKYMMEQYVNIVTPHNQIRLLFGSEFSMTDEKVRKVVMGDKDITEECLCDGKVQIPSVSETVVIYY